MTHNKFIELLNLYLDHEISMEDAAALEAEIQRDPKRLAIYRQYCQIQRGCQQLADDFAVAPTTAASRQVELSAPAQRFALPGWMYGAAAVAACAVFAFVTLMRQSPSVVATSAPAAQSSQAQLFAHTPPPVSSPAVYSFGELVKSRPELHAVYTPTLTNFSAENTEKPTFFIANSSAQFDWMDEVKLAPVDNREHIFHVQPVAADGVRAYRSQRAIEGKVEMTAFQFQR